MALLTCPDCGNKVSDRATACSACGCPIDYIKLAELLKQTTPEVVETFEIAGNMIVYPVNEYNYLVAHRAFEAMAWKLRKRFIEETEAARRAYDLLYSDNILKMIIADWMSMIKIARDELIEEGIDFVNEETLMNKFLQNFDIDYYLKDYIVGKEKVMQFVEELNYKRGVQRSSRSKWVGGGFGIKGALVGSVKAGVLNLGTEAIRGIGDSLINASDRSKLESFKAEILRQGKAYNSLCATYYQGVCAIGDIKYLVLVEEGKLNSCDTWWSKERLDGKVDNTMQLYIEGRYSKSEAIQNLCECVEKHPMNWDPLLYIYQIDSSTKEEILKISQLIGIAEAVTDLTQQLDRGGKLKWEI